MELASLIATIDERRQQLEAYGPLAPDQRKRLEQKVRIDWTYHSNAIEGNQLTYGDTRSLLIWGLTAKGKPIRDHLDIEGHNQAIKQLEALARKDTPLSVTLIKEFHRLILAEPFNEYRQDVLVGQYKKEGNYLYNHRGERVDFCPPDEVAQRLNELITWTNNALDPPKRSRTAYAIHPLLIATRFHLEFVNIHPFDDGNGRMARIFSNLILMQCGYPPYIIPVSDRDTYVQAIQLAREDGLDILALFIGQRLLESLDLYLRAAQGLPITAESDLDRQINLLTRQLDAYGPGILANEENLPQLITENGLGNLLTRSHEILTKLEKVFPAGFMHGEFMATNDENKPVSSNELSALKTTASTNAVNETALALKKGWYDNGLTKAEKLRLLTRHFKVVNQVEFRSVLNQSPYQLLRNLEVQSKENIYFYGKEYEYQFTLIWHDKGVKLETIFRYEWREVYANPPDVDEFSHQLTTAIQGILNRIEERVNPTTLS